MIKIYPTKKSHYTSLHLTEIDASDIMLRMEYLGIPWHAFSRSKFSNAIAKHLRLGPQVLIIYQIQFFFFQLELSLLYLYYESLLCFR